MIFRQKTIRNVWKELELLKESILRGPTVHEKTLGTLYYFLSVIQFMDLVVRYANIFSLCQTEYVEFL